MADLDRRIKSSIGRANAYLQEIQSNYREALVLSNKIKSMANSYEQSEVTLKKVDILKMEIKDKLKQFSTHLEEVYKIIDKKITILSIELNKEQMNATAQFNQKKQFSLKAENPSPNAHQITYASLEKQLIKNEKELVKNQQKVQQLQDVVTYYQKNQAILTRKLEESKIKNDKLMQEFDTLSSASNKKINELHSQLKNHDGHKNERKKIFTPQKEAPEFEISPLIHAKRKEQNSKLNHITVTEQQRSFVEQYSYSSNMQYYPPFEQKEDNTKKNLSFGCMPNVASSDSGKIKLEKLSLMNVKYQPDDPLDKVDKDRRYEFLLSNLREGQESTEVSNSMESNKPDAAEPIVSALSKNVIRKYQI